jgi:hypothetical protein
MFTNFWRLPGSVKPSALRGSNQLTQRRVRFERLERRDMMAADANLIAYRPITEYINYAQFAVPDAQETDPSRGPGIRINGDDDNRNGLPDYVDSTTAASGDFDLVRVDIRGTGTSFSVSWSGPLVLWSSLTKTESIPNGGQVLANQTVWVEYASQTHSVGASASLALSAIDSVTNLTAADQVVFHSFRSVVLAIGGNGQSPSNFGDSRLGVYTIGGNLYNQGYDVRLYAHDQVATNGLGAAYDEVVSAVLNRNVDSVAIYGYSWGGGATYDLSVALNKNAALAPAGYRLAYTAYVDAIRHYSLGAETRKPIGTLVHDNFYQRKDWLLRGTSISGSNNVNVTQTTWGRSLTHTTIDDNATLQSLLINSLITRIVA